MSGAYLVLGSDRGCGSRGRGPLGRRKGAVLVLSVTALLALIACAALAIDVGILAMAASRAQNVADAAALAAAGSTINGQSAAVRQRIDDIVTANNAGCPSRMACGGRDVLVYPSGAAIAGYGELTSGQEAVKVAVEIPVALTFARALGVQNRQIIRTATALRTPASGGDAIIFAACTDSGESGYHMSGQRARIGGRVHSNCPIQISGGYGVYTGPVEYRNKFANSGQNNMFQQGVSVGQIEPFPLNYTPEDFGPYDYEISHFGLSTGNTTVPPGVYRVHGEVRISGENTIMDNVTWVADGQVTISGKNCRYTANRLGMFAYSLDDGSNAIQVSGGGNGCVGTLFAPNGTAHFSGASMTTTYGAIIAQTVEISGGDFALAFPPDAAGGSLVKLIK